jgi:hypothetical protein
LPEEWDNTKLIESIYPAEKQQNQTSQGKVLPDYPVVHRELARKGANMKLLWTEYVQTCQQTGANYLQYAQFCIRSRQFAQRTKATIHMQHKFCEKCEINWAGTTYEIWTKNMAGEANQPWPMQSSTAVSTTLITSILTVIQSVRK